MARLVLIANRGGTNGSSGVTLLNGSAVTGYAMVDGIDWGNYDPELVYSQRKDGASTATDYNLAPRVAQFPVKVIGSTYAVALASMNTLGKEVAACQRSGGRLVYQSNSATYPVYLTVRGARYTTGSIVSNRMEVHFSTVGVMTLQCDPAAVGDSMSFRDEFSTDTSTSWTQDAGAWTISGGLVSYGSNGAKRARHTARGYAYTDVQVTMKITAGSTVASADWAVMARCQGTADTALIARIQGSGTNLLSVATVKAGVVATLASTAFVPVVSTNYWLRLRIEGSVMTAEVFATEPKPLDAATATISSTLTAVDQQAFVSGMTGIRTTLVAFATERFDDFDVRPYTYRLASPEVVRLTGIPGDLPAFVDTEVTVPAALATQAVFGGVWWAERQRQVNYCWNGNLEQTIAGNTQGWVNATVAGVISQALGSGPTRTTSASKFGLASVEFLTTAVANQGLNFPMPRRFKKGRDYIGLSWLQSAAGVGSCDLVLGLSGDLGTAAATAVSATYKLYSSRWTPTADRDIAYLAPRHVAATAETIRADGLGVFEATPLTLNGAIVSTSATSCVATAVAPEGTPPVPFVSIIDAGLSSQELVRVTAIATDGVTRTIDRGWDGSTAATHLTAATMHDLPGYWFDANSDGSHASMLDVVGLANPFSTAGSITTMTALAATRSGFVASSSTAVTTMTVTTLLDPWTMVPPDFSGDEILVELWVRFSVNANPPSPRFTVSVSGEEGTMTPVRYDLENGSGGLAILSPTGAVSRFARIGVIPIRYSEAQQRRRVQVIVQYDITSAGTAINYDYLMLAPAGNRGTSPTGRLDDSSYPDFILGTSTQQTRRIYSDFSSEVGRSRETFAAGNLNPGGGIIGVDSSMAFGAPNADAMIKLSNIVPNGGVAADTGELLSTAADATITATFNPTPRFLTLR